MGKGEIQGYFYARGFAPCIPGAEPARHWERGRTTHPAGGLPPALPLDLAAVVLAGGLIFLVACLPCLLLSFLPPIPPPPSPAGKGDQGYFMQGASPLASPGQNPRGTGEGGEPRAQRGACPRRCRLTLPLWYPQGGLSFWSPADPAFCFPFCPLSPHPLPRRGRGRFKVISCKGLRPLHPRGLNPGGTCTTKGFCLFTGGQCRQPRRGGTGGEELSVARDGGV